MYCFQTHANRSGLICLLTFFFIGFVSLSGCNFQTASEDSQIRSQSTDTEKINAPNSILKLAQVDNKQFVSFDDQNKADAKKPADAPPADPFPFTQEAPSLKGGVAWLNTAGPIDLKKLRGKFVVLDFWTYCCINCMHVLPELKKLEKAYPNNVVVIGVHTAKFDTEKNTQNIKEAILRYEIEHPVINDARQIIWNKYGVTGWPGIKVIDPEGRLIAQQGGETKFKTFDFFFKKFIPIYRKRGTLNEKPLHFQLEASQVKPTPLRFPGKILADQHGKRLFISDSNNNRIVITSFEGKLIEVIGSGEMGAADGSFDKATFDHPQGTALIGETLYVADTENHLLRKIDLKKKTVKTIAGIGTQAEMSWPGLTRFATKYPDRYVGKPLKTGLNSPWALVVDKKSLYIAMAGPHQIWKMPLDESEIGLYAGNGREDIVDGKLLPKRPYESPGFSSFAQPSGLVSDGSWIYVADSEGSSIRAVPLDQKKEVKTIIGTEHLPGGRLFSFGDQDGQGKKVQLQHCLGITHHAGLLYLADTYNHKIKVLDIKKQTCKTIAGNENPDKKDTPPTFNEPAGISYAAGKLFVADTNHHRICVIDLKNGNKVSTLTIAGLSPPKKKRKVRLPDYKNATAVNLKPTTVKAVNNEIVISAELNLPLGWKINTAAPTTYHIANSSQTTLIDAKSLNRWVEPKKPTKKLQIRLPLIKNQGQETLKIYLEYYYCEDKKLGVCKTGSVVWTVPIELITTAKESQIRLSYDVQE